MVGGNAVVAQELGRLRRASAVAHIHDARARVAVHNPQHPAELVLLVDHKVGQVPPLETLLEHILGLEVQPCLDILDHLRGGRGGERENRRLGKDFTDLRNL